MIKVVRYTEHSKKEWDMFIELSKNGTFLFKRDFMEYHKDRFEDYSLMVYSKEKLVACFPANINKNKTVTSHSGLTYGGIIVSELLRLNEYLKVFREILLFLNSNNISILYYKSIPCFYTIQPSEEDSYALFLLEADNYRTDTALTIKNKSLTKIPYQTRRKRSMKKSNKLTVKIENEKGYEVFWNEILEPNLEKRFGKKPVHSLKEIKILDAKFPNNIHQINIFCNDTIVAGATIFETKTTAHAQYISGNDFGRNSGALDRLFDELINNFFSEKEYFDFGICNERDGKYINHGLLDWKEGFGGRSYVHRFYKIETKNYENLDVVIK